MNKDQLDDPEEARTEIYNATARDFAAEGCVTIDFVHRCLANQTYSEC